MGSSVILPPQGQPVKGPDPNFTSASQPAAVQFLTTQIAPPSPLYIARDDLLGVVVYSNLAGLTVNVSGRILLPAGTEIGAPGQPGHKGEAQKISTPLIQPFLKTFTPTTNRARNHFFLDLFECFLLGVEVYAGAPGGFTRGNVFVDLQLNRGGTITTFGTQDLIADYVHPAYGLSWPGGRLNSPVEGPGFLQSISVANPAAGAEWSQAVPVGARWRIQSARFTLTTNATVANRVVQCNVQNPTPSSVFLGSPNQVVPASQAVQVTFSPGVPTAVANVTDVMCQLNSPAYLPAGWLIGTRSANLNAGDQYSSIFLEVEEWLDPLT